MNVGAAGEGRPSRKFRDFYCTPGVLVGQIRKREPIKIFSGNSCAVGGLKMAELLRSRVGWNGDWFLNRAIRRARFIFKTPEVCAYK